MQTEPKDGEYWWIQYTANFTGETGVEIALCGKFIRTVEWSICGSDETVKNDKYHTVVPLRKIEPYAEGEKK